MNYGFVKLAAAVPSLRVADCDYNATEIIRSIREADKNNVEIVCFPELSITSYSCADLFFQQQLHLDAEKALERILNETTPFELVAVVGMPLVLNATLYNVAVVISKGQILGVVPKHNIVNNHERNEQRWFSSGVDVPLQNIELAKRDTFFAKNILFESEQYRFAVEVGDDLLALVPPSSYLAQQGADIIVNPAAFNELVGKRNYIEQSIKLHSAKTKTAYLLASAGYGESSTDAVFTGSAFIAEKAEMVAMTEPYQIKYPLLISDVDVQKLQADRLRDKNFFSAKNIDTPIVPFEYVPLSAFTLNREIPKHPFIPSENKREETLNEIFNIQISALAKRWEHTRLDKLYIGVSGGLDSTLALMVCVAAADKLGYSRKQIAGITMPGFGTTNRTYHNALKLMEALGVSMQEISIKEASLLHFKDIGHDVNLHDVTYENVQARERTQILMDLANKNNGMVIGTGDLSEMALGWSTYNGDHMSMYAINSSIPKTLVKTLIDWISDSHEGNVKTILKDILDTPVSPELLPAENDTIIQKTEDIVGPYELHDFFIYYFIRYGFSPKKLLFLATNAFANEYSKKEIKKWLDLFVKRFYQQQFKRSCTPDGPKVGSVSFSPRGDWMMPSDAATP